jgi:hypothetical protein
MQEFFEFDLSSARRERKYWNIENIVLTLIDVFVNVTAQRFKIINKILTMNSQSRCE